MYASSTRPSTKAFSRFRQIAAIALCAAPLLFILTLAALPAAALAAAHKPARRQATSVSAMPAPAVEEVLSSVPLTALSATQLGELLSRSPELNLFPAGTLRDALSEAIGELAAKGDTLGALANSGELKSKLETKLSEALTAPELLSLLKGHTLSSVLAGALGSLAPGQMLGGLLEAAAKPEQLIEAALTTPSPEKLETLVGAALTGEPFTKGTTGELASQIGTTPEGLAEEMETSASELPSSAMALTAPLTDGKTLGVMDALDGLDLGVLSPSEEEPAEGSGGSGGAGGSGGSGGSGSGSGGAGSGSGDPGSGSGAGAGSGSSAVPASVTIVMNYPLADGAAAAHPGAHATLAKVEILSHRVKNGKVTLVVQVPAAGRLSVRGAGIKAVKRQVAGAEHVTLKVALSKASVASLRRRHHHRRLKIEATFKPVSGASVSTSATVVLG